jgi:predicted DNA-binding ribbon-helix-helix protein
MQKRSLKIAGHATSIALEPEFWEALKDIAHQKGLSLPSLVATLDNNQDTFLRKNLASQLRVFVLNHYTQKADKLY